MCGIVGFYNPTEGKANWFADSIMPELLFVNQLRGRDATGLFGVTQKDPTWVDHIKVAGSADAFLDWKKVHERFIKPAEHFKFMVGHNRAATIGGKDDVKAAHPHVVGAITLVHNGTLHNFPKDKFISDSYWFTSLLNDNKGDFLACEKDLYGAYAFVWHDAGDNSLNFVRNSSRPLGFVKTLDDVVWFASEPTMFKLVGGRKNKSISKEWNLQERLWIKILPDGKVVETRVPYTSSDKAKVERELSFEEWNNEPENKRAATTVYYGRRESRLWDGMEDHHFEDGRGARPLALPTPQNYSRNSAATSESSEGGGREGKPLVVRLEEFNGIGVGDEVYYYPKVFREGTNGKGIIIEGAYMTWGGSGIVSFEQGIRVVARMESERPQRDMNYLGDLDCCFSGTVTAIVKNKTMNRVIFYCKDADSHDMVTPESCEFNLKEVDAAWEAKYVEPTPVVIVEPDTPEEGDPTDVYQGCGSKDKCPRCPANECTMVQEALGVVPTKTKSESVKEIGKCRCGAAADQGMCFQPKQQRQSDCIFDPKPDIETRLKQSKATEPVIVTQCQLDIPIEQAVDIYKRRQQDKANWVPNVTEPYNVRCEACRKLVNVFSPEGSYVYEVLWRHPRKSPTEGKISSEKMNICGACEDGFVQMYANAATLTLVAKHGFKFDPKLAATLAKEGKPTKSFS